jgi:hypothetical protein
MCVETGFHTHTHTHTHTHGATHFKYETQNSCTPLRWVSRRLYCTYADRHVDDMDTSYGHRKITELEALMHIRAWPSLFTQKQLRNFGYGPAQPRKRMGIYAGAPKKQVIHKMDTRNGCTVRTHHNHWELKLGQRKMILRQRTYVSPLSGWAFDDEVVQSIIPGKLWTQSRSP